MTRPRAKPLRALRWLALVSALLLPVAPTASAPAPAPASAHAPVPLDVALRPAAERLIGAALVSDHAYLRLSQLCDGIGHRLSGSPALERAVEWAATMIEPGPQMLSILGLGRSIGTPPGGITAEVVAVDSFADLDALPADAVRGRIVLYDVPFTKYSETVRYRSEGAKRAAARGAVAALVRSVGPVSLRTPHTGAMSPYVDSIPRIPAAAVTIEDATMMHRLLARGERVRVHLEMGADTLLDGRSHNVIGEIRGRERPDEVVVVGGHIDSWDVGAGAHDDGGGCVIAMESLRLMKQLRLRPRRTVRVVLWTNEENGLRGANAYRDSLGAGVAGHVAAIETDGGVERVVGFDVGVSRIGTDSTDAPRTAAATARLKAMAPLFVGLGADSVGPGGGGADIGPLMRKGVPGIAHRTTMEHYFDWHHTQADMLDKVDPIELRKNVAALAVMVYALAEMPERLGDLATPVARAGVAPRPAVGARP
jgi:peptidase M28-like protein